MPEQPLPFYIAASDPPAKQAILAAALALFTAHGIDGVTVRDIAARAGFTNPALFRHFAGKDELAQQLFEACYRRLVLALAATPAEPLQQRFAASLALIEQSPDSVHYVLENLRRCFPALPEDLRQAGLPGTMRRLAAAEQAAGRMRADADPALVATLILGTLGQVARLAAFAELPAPASQLAAPLWTLITNGTGA